MQRLERLLPSLESLRAGGGTGRGETPASLQDRKELLERFDQLGQQLNEQLEALRRRIALRARPAGQGLDEATVDAIADAVVARPGAPQRRAGTGTRARARAASPGPTAGGACRPRERLPR